VLLRYRCRGGIAREIEVLVHLKQRWSQPDSQPTRPVGFERAIRFSWSGWTWLPMFQFNPIDMSLSAAPARVVEELGPAFDGWEIAQWFVGSNSSLGGQRPIDVLGQQPTRVIEAARVTRFIAAG
jgi:hypothetical protein